MKRGGPVRVRPFFFAARVRRAGLRPAAGYLVSGSAPAGVSGSAFLAGSIMGVVMVPAPAEPFRAIWCIMSSCMPAT